VQLSSVNAIAVTDLNKDNKPDLLLGGNLFDFPPQFGRLDGSYGHVLLNAGKGKYQWVEASQSGLSLRGAIKDIKEIKIGTGNKTYFTITQNNQQPVMLQVKQ
jgi:enediyne biosynthesis protein E4